ncbi:translocation/assembly module TamB domain-containing protein [Deinococcus maricopensis]|uniref:Translocation and assembly module TamB C-terminal domain-containing protein n=1 Tax=Deinococcus maricopensis (strain DSM 21211 / LMG 22137 / NRRL B-23946 / LB-34) TaxID=709986 RepID=E8U9A2_DEIML|nr:translocation/assembly module TamB domain-containing protein [Deinococcus maricopensis]ADV67641.1 protein of unknown function DUF490 [Deinococcus maricopensis DSM 21211]
MSRARWSLVVLFLIFFATLAVALFGVPLLGPALLGALPPDLRLSASHLSGPLWAPRLNGVRLVTKGLSGTASGVTLRIGGVDFAHHTLRIDATVNGGNVNVDLPKLFGQHGAPGAWSVVPGNIRVQDTKLNVQGREWGVPDGTFRIDGTERGLRITGRTLDGTLRADVALSAQGKDVTGTADLRADATVLNAYWPKSIRGGVIEGRYTFGRTVSGDLRLRDGLLIVPDAPFTRVRDLGGALTHRGDRIEVTLAGRAWDGPIQVKGYVDTRAQHWDFSGKATPSLAGLARALGTTGQGTADLTAHAYGWNQARVAMEGSSARGTFAGVPFTGLALSYAYRAAAGKDEGENTVTFAARTQLAGQQRLSGRWAIEREGQATWAGDLAGRPLDLRADILGREVRVAGRALGDAARASYHLSTRTLSADAGLNFGAVRARLTANGTLDELDLAVRDGTAAGIPLQGRGRYDRQGLRADLGALAVNLDRQLRGTWTARDANVSGVRLNGAGRLDVGASTLTGTLSGQPPLDSEVLRGPVRVNWRDRQGRWAFGSGDATWQGETATVQVRGTRLAGFDARGRVTVGLGGPLTATGEVRGQSPLGTLVLSGAGRAVDLRATVSGVRVTGRTLLHEPYDTTLTLSGADVMADVRVQNGVDFVVRSGRERATGRFADGQLVASGRVNLGAFAPVARAVGVQDLGGTVDFNLGRQGGLARVNASAFGVRAVGTLTGTNGGMLNANVTLSGPDGAAATLAGAVLPRVDVRGPVTYRGATLNARLSGEPGRLAFTASGVAPSLGMGDTSVPALPLTVRGTLTPALSATGTWGGVRVAYAGAQVRVNGTLPVTVFGEAGQARLNGRWAPDWTGRVQADVQAGPYALNARGPWTALSVAVRGPDGLSATGTVDARTQQYAASVRGPLAGVFVDARVSGRGADIRGRGTLADGGGGTARFTLNGLQDFRLQAGGLRLGGQAVNGTLSATRGRLNGDLRVAGLNVTARDGRVAASGTFGGQQVRVNGELTLPLNVRTLRVTSDGPYARLRASGTGGHVRGTLLVKAQTLGPDGARVRVTSTTLPVDATLTPLRVQVGGLAYDGGWRGAQALGYALNGERGALTLAGRGAALTLAPSGPVRGRLQVLPDLRGQLAVALPSVRAALPAQVARELTGGELRANLFPTGANVTLNGARYVGQPLGATAALTWADGTRLSGLLTHPGTRVPFRADAGGLHVNGATLDALALRPVLAAQGRVTLDLDLPGYALDRGRGRASVDLRAAGGAARGTVTLGGGRLSADLNSTLGGRTVTLNGPLYPTANATVRVDGASGRLTGSVREALTLVAGGTLDGRDLTLNATYRPQGADVRATYAGARADLTFTQVRGTWRADGALSVPDLQPLTGTAGRVSATVRGPLNALRVDAGGTVAGATFTAPALWDGQALRVNGATVTADFARARLSGTVYPALNAAGNVTVTDGLPGTYTAALRGTFTKPDVRLGGTLGGSVQGLDATGTRLDARLLGRDWRVTATGERLAGAARGRLGGNVAGGLQSARFTLNATYANGADTRVTLRGPVGWNARTGWLGALGATGTVDRQALDARVTGDGPLAVAAALGGATLNGRFPASLLTQPGGELNLARLDAGALWGRPEQVRVTGTARLGGTWQHPSAALTGALEDTRGDLSGSFRGAYAGGNTDVTLTGLRLSGTAALRDGTFSVTARAAGADLARLAPASWNVTALRLSGRVDARGRTAGGLERATLTGLDVRAASEATGDVRLLGNATYTPDALSADLTGRALGGTFTARGALPDGVTVRVQDVDARGAGRVNGTLTLTGRAADPAVRADLAVAREDLTARVQAFGRARDPLVRATADLRGSASGRVYAEARDVRLNPPGANVRVYGAAGTTAGSARLDFAGAWPALRGQATVTLGALQDPVRVMGDGSGAYTLDAGRLGSGRVTLAGLVPTVTGTLRLTPLALVDGATGSGTVNVNLSGPVTALRLSADGVLRGVNAAGVQIADLGVNVAGTPADLRGTVTQAGRTTGTFDGQTLTLQGLTARAFGTDVTASGPVALAGRADLTVTASGSINGRARVTYDGARLTAGGALGAGGANVTFDVQASDRLGWSGNGRLTGLPSPLLTGDAAFTVSGPLRDPRVQGDVPLLGARGQLNARPLGGTLTLALTNSPDARGEGALTLADGQWGGRAQLTRDEGQLALSLSGALAAPVAGVDVTVGAWHASGQVANGDALLSLTDGAARGTFAWQGDRLLLDVPPLNLAGLGLAAVRGTVSASGEYALSSSAGNVRVTGTDLRTGLTLPVVDLPLDGTLSATASVRSGRLQVAANAGTPAGTLSADLARADGRWSGLLRADLKRDAGTLGANITLGADGARGVVSATAFPLALGGVQADLGGTVRLNGSTFALDASLSSNQGRVSATGSGGLADAVPQLTALLGTPATGDGYQVQAQLASVRLEDLSIAPYLRGRVSGTATVTDGSGTFSLTSADLNAAGTNLPARVEGTLTDGAWRLRGAVGDSQLFGSLGNGTLTGRLELQALPVGALLSAVSGPLPGEGFVTGTARFSVPLARPLDGTVNLVAERIRVAAGDQSLTGTGVLAYADGELRDVNVQLSGAGRWDVRGAYTRERVNLTANFQNTTFTPVLSLLPGLRGSAPNLNGNLRLTVAGTYDQPTGRLDASALQGAVGNVRVHVPALSGTLENSGRLTAGGTVQVGGGVGANGALTLRAQLTRGVLSGTVAEYAGDASIEQVGSLGRTALSVRQTGDAWTLDGTAVQGGTLRLSGTVAPRIDVRLTARGYAPQVQAIYARETSIDADLSAAESGSTRDITVSGAVTLGRLVLGRTNVPASTLPAPSGTPAANAGTRSDFVSPLPEELRRFPTPEGEDVDNPLLERVRFADIPVRAPNGIRVNESLGQAELAGGLVLSGTAADPVLSGGVQVVRGSLFLRENEFRLTQGNINFDGTSVYPTFAVVADGTVLDTNGGGLVGVNLNVQGSFPSRAGLQLETRLTCTSNCGASYDPSSGAAEANLYALVALGTPDLNSLPANFGALGNSALRTALNLFVLGELNRNIARALGVDVFRINADLIDPVTGFSAGVTIGTYLSRQFYLQYQIDLSGAGLLDATYTTEDGRFTFKLSSPLNGLDLSSLRPSFSVGYNLNNRTTVQLGVTSGNRSTTFRFGLTYRP